jgi:sarcosine oxidase subunit alpha
VRFRFDGRWVQGYESDTIGSALHAAGVRVLSRSFKYHRPRGLLCMSGDCPNCLVNVDGVAHVRACRTPVRDGMRVRSQRGWPTLERDALGIVDRLDPMLPVGFYYKTFIHPRRLWPVYEELLRRVAGFGDLDHRRPPAVEYTKEHYFADVAVVGGGPAGLAAARAAAQAGAHVVLVDDQPQLGGHLRYQGQAPPRGTFAGQPGYAIAHRLAAEATREPRVEVFLNAVAFGLYEDNLLGVLQEQRLIKLRADQIVVATGRYEHLLPFHNNDLPGILLGGGVQRLIHLYGVRPGNQALVVSGNDRGLAVAADLLEADVGVVGVVELRARLDESLAEVQRLRAAGVPLLAGHVIREARGTDRVTGAVVARLDGAGNLVRGSTWQVACDLICLSAGLDTATALLQQGGCKLRYEAAQAEFVPETLVPGVLAAGGVAGTHGLDAICADGERIGRAAAAHLRADSGDDAAEATTYTLPQQPTDRPAARVLPSVPRPRAKQFVCLCEDVTEKDLCAAIDEGFDGVEYLKRYTTYSMGPCQGRMCARSALAITARETGRTIAQVGTTTARPPSTPVPMGALAGRPWTPTKLTPIHAQHLALGADMMDAGVWQRPRQYAPDVLDEVRAVRDSVGLIDLSTLGKLEVVGRDAVALLEKIFINKVADLPIGRRVRYWVLCDDAGIIIDEGTVLRLATDRIFLTTSSAGAGSTADWLRWWTASMRLDVYVVNYTDGLAAVNLAGPRAREMLAPLTDVDLSNAAFPYLGAARGQVAGVPALLLRVGFVGELGYEIHVPAEYGAYIWDTLQEAGRAYALRPFGVEAQRILRLEKRHLIATVDTDALSTALEADLAWAVKFDKREFIGRTSLLQVRERGLRQKLVGYVMDDPQLVPADGSAVVVDGRPVGRVTSARFSPTLARSIGMAWVPAEGAAPAAAFYVRVDGRLARARVVAGPFYDPQGERMKA